MNEDWKCCGNLFSDFKFKDIRMAQPPENKGVYVIRVKKRGSPIEEVVRRAKQVIDQLDWTIVSEKMFNRIERLENVKQCPVIYIGSAGTRSSSEHTLKGRYKDFGGRHTAMYPLWALLYFGWELEYGWKEEAQCARLEKSLKKSYKRAHKGKLPALVYR